MNFLRKLLGLGAKKPPAAKATTAVDATAGDAASAAGDPAQDPNLIKLYDAYGREIFVTREQWTGTILPDTLKTNWDNPDALYNVVTRAMEDGFESSVVEAARHLYEIDPDRVRATCVWGVSLLEQKRLDEAEQVFTTHLKKHGESGYVLTNLAKVYSSRSDDAATMRTLWRSLEVDPNQANALDWVRNLHRERGGETAEREALQRVAALPGSWRAQLWLAREALIAGQLEQALGLYDDSLARAGRPVPAELLMHLSGDLGNHGHLADLIRLTAPHFDAAVHGVAVGNNLIKGNVDLGKLDEAQAILDALYAQKRPDWQETLAFWDTELARKRIAAKPTPQTGLEFTNLTIEGPIWLPSNSPATSLFPSPRRESPLICFVGSSVERSEVDSEVQRQLADAPGRISRTAPLFLAEQTQFYTVARTKTLIPWLVKPEHSFVVACTRWADDETAHWARQGDEPADFLVISHVDPLKTTWQIDLRLIRTIDATCLATATQPIEMTQLEDGFGPLVSQLHALLSEHAGVLPRPSTSTYQAPQGASFGNYLLRLEQLLAVRSAAVPEVAATFLHGEREILGGTLQLCLDNPASLACRTLLAQMVVAMKRVRPNVVAEFDVKLRLLQTSHPLEAGAHAIIDGMIESALASEESH